MARLPWDNPNRIEKGERYVRERSADPYHTARWTRLSRAFRAEHPLCAECNRKGIIRPATCVDHIVPWPICADRFYDRTNLQALCDECNHLKGQQDKKRIQEWKSNHEHEIPGIIASLTRKPKKDYTSPELTSMSEPGEIWKPIAFAADYMISNHKRVWSWKTCRFVGKINCNGKMDVLFSIDGQYKTMGIDKIYAEAFGYNPPTEPGEEWRESVSPGILVSSLGRLFSTWNLELMSPYKRPSGYLYIKGRDRRWPVHRLVAFAFVKGRDIFRDSVDHINEDKTDNRADNLRWCTDEENTQFYLDNHAGAGKKARRTSAKTTPPVSLPREVIFEPK